MTNQPDIIDQGAGPVLVLLHGAGVDHDLWAPQIAAFSATHRVIAPNLPGHGGVPLAADIPQMADQMRQVLHQRDIHQYALVGLSLGGMVAMDMAGHWPDEVTHLCLTECVPHVTANPLARAFAGLAVAMLGLISPRLLAAGPARQMGAMTEEAGAYIKSALRRMTRQRNRAVMQAALAYDGRPYLSQIAAPTLVMVGQMNRQTHRRARQMADAIPNAQYVILPGAGHIANRDAPQVFNQTLQSFLKGAA